MKLRILSIIFFVFLITTPTFAQSSNDWVRFRNGNMPSDAVEGGYESNGEKTFVCRVRYGGSYISGRAQYNQCFYNKGNGESSASNFEVLVGKGYSWSRSKNYDRAVVAGGSSEENYYVCRVSASGGLYPGRTENDNCYYTRDRRGYSSRTFEVLQGNSYNTNLLGAASRGDYQAVKDALRDGQAINQTDSNGKTALMLASEKGYESVIRELLYERATIDLPDKTGNTALMLAAANGYSDIVRNLLREGANFNSRNDNGDTAFTLAASGGHSRLISDFLNYDDFGRVERSDVERGFRNAAYNGHTNVLELLYEYGASVESQGADGRTALMLASMGGKADAVRYLLRNDASINSRDNNGFTPFLYGIDADSESVLSVFMDESKFIKFDDAEAERGLILAASNDRRRSLRYLLQKGVDVNSQNQSDGLTPLMLTSGGGHDEATEILINSNADLNIQNDDGETALMLAAANSKNNTTKVLIKAGADLNLRDKNGLTALGWAIRNKHKDTRKTLEKAKAKQ